MGEKTTTPGITLTNRQIRKLLEEFNRVLEPMKRDLAKMDKNSAMYWKKLEDIQYVIARRRERISDNVLAMYKENIEARRYYCDSGLNALGAAICLQAVTDWKKPKKVVERTNWSYYDEREIAAAERARKECEEFFDSDMFMDITGMSGKEETIRRLKALPSMSMEVLEQFNRRKNA